ncbi:mitochondrial fission regulator 2 [Bufo bufo]|uniref:mitochondrial fission regulator 2 n=1 Tax=Bufo bufo TaxID=8384 RepID=UPI001ABEC911|nr:mitochondrial fission regulator 2 [Bufo bufo]
MSLLLELLRQLLEYLGVPAEQLVPVWERFTRRRSIVRAIANRLPPVLFEGIDIQCIQVLERKNYGWTRSVVRIIGTLLPLERCPRPHFQKILGPGVLESEEYEAMKRSDIPSLADAPCLLDDNVMTYTRFRHDFPSSKSMGEVHLAGPPNTDSGFLTIVSGNRVSEISLLPANDHAFQKIAALEDELVQLRAQIAGIVAMQESKATQSYTESICSVGSPSNALPPPSLASTPLSAQFSQCTTPVPPPPPPPPPPAPPSNLNSAKSAISLIKERKASHKRSPMERDTVDKLPSMMDVLKGINTIKLRTVERSPGGTPLTRKDKKRRSLNDPTDPAAIIARALKQKFAHRHKDDSYDKENRSCEDSPFSSPETPMFGRHLLKPVGKRTQRELTSRQVHA